MTAQQELDRLRLELIARDMEIIRLNTQIRDMRCCENCKHLHDNGQVVDCVKMEEACELPTLKAWEAIK